MTAEFDKSRPGGDANEVSTVNKRYEPPSQEIREAFAEFVRIADALSGEDGAMYAPGDAQHLLRYLDSLPEHVLRALMYHARNGGLA